jgi:prepilin-type N-terminal cleavage/methylation domain-containing protein
MRRGTSQGFTLIELMFAMLVFVVSVVGLIGMQKASIGAAKRAKTQTAAYDIARFVTTQIKTEIANWQRTTMAPLVEDGEIDRFPLLGQVLAEVTPGVGDNSVGVWVQYGANVNTGADNGDFRVDEFLGHSELTGNMGPSRFCVNFSLLPMFANADNIGEQHVWMVRVRTSWTKDGYYAPVGGFAWTDCSPAAVDARLDPAVAVDNVVELVTMATREFAL